MNLNCRGGLGVLEPRGAPSSVLEETCQELDRALPRRALLWMEVRDWLGSSGTNYLRVSGGAQVFTIPDRSYAQHSLSGSMVIAPESRSVPFGHEHRRDVTR